MVGYRSAMSTLWTRLASAPALVVVAVSTAIPLMAISVQHIASVDIFAVWQRPGVKEALFFSLWQGVLSTVLTLAFGLFPTWVLARYQFTGRSILVALVTVPFVLPTIAVGAAFLAVLPTSLHRTTWAILLAHIFFNISVVVRTVGPLWRSVDQGLIESAQTLGASPAQVYRHLLLPIARPAIISAGSLIFVMCFTSYGIIRILGGPGLATLDIEIYRRAVQLGDISGATVLGITQTLCIACAFAWWSRSQGAQFSKIGDRNSARALNRSSRIIVFLTAAAFTAPLGALIFSSLHTRDSWSLTGWKVLFGLQDIRGLSIDLPSSLATSLVYALAATAIAVPVGMAATAFARRHWIHTAVVLPLSTSPVVLGLAILITYDRAPFDFRSSRLLIPLVHAAIALPFVMRATIAIGNVIPPDLRHAAETLGASPWRRWLNIDLPLLRPALATGVAFSLAMSLGEFGATSFLTRRNSSTLPISIANLFSRAGDIPRSTGMAAATLLIFITGLLVISVDRRSYS